MLVRCITICSYGLTSITRSQEHEGTNKLTDKIVMKFNHDDNDNVGYITKYLFTNIKRSKIQSTTLN